MQLKGGGGNFAQDWHINQNTDGFCSVRTEVWRVATWSYGLVSTLSFCGRDAQKPEIIITTLLWEQEIWAREFHWIEMFYRGVDLINRRIITLTDPDIPLPWRCMKMFFLGETPFYCIEGHTYQKKRKKVSKLDSRPEFQLPHSSCLSCTWFLSRTSLLDISRESPNGCILQMAGPQNNSQMVFIFYILYGQRLFLYLGYLISCHVSWLFYGPAWLSGLVYLW